MMKRDILRKKKGEKGLYSDQRTDRWNRIY